MKVNKEKGEVYVNFRDAYLPLKRMQIWKGEQRLNFSVLWEQAEVMDCESMCWFSIRSVDLSKTIICFFVFFVFLSIVNYGVTCLLWYLLRLFGFVDSKSITNLGDPLMNR